MQDSQEPTPNHYTFVYNSSFINCYSPAIIFMSLLANFSNNLELHIYSQIYDHFFLNNTTALSFYCYVYLAIYCPHRHYTPQMASLVRTTYLYRQMFNHSFLNNNNTTALAFYCYIYSAKYFPHRHYTSYGFSSQNYMPIQVDVQPFFLKQKHQSLSILMLCLLSQILSTQTLHLIWFLQL